MKLLTARTSKLLILCLAVSLSLGGVGCKGKKKLAEEKARQEQMAAQKKNEAIRALEGILGTSAQSTAEIDALERQLAEIKAQNLEDAEVMVLIRKAEYHLQQERERLERERQAAEAAAAAEAESKNVGPRVSQLFGEISRAGNDAIANAKINDALRLFSSSDSPVLIIISESAAGADYDRPTTISKYLNYLKDTGNNVNAVRNVVLDSNGKIKELELIKQK